MVNLQKKTFNGDGQGVAKPLKNHRWQWSPEEKTLPSHRLKKRTIVEVYSDYFRHLLIFSSAKYNYMIWEWVEKRSGQKFENWAF